MTVFSWPVMLTPDGAAPEVKEALVEFVGGRAGNLRGSRRAHGESKDGESR
jgi:hypothetical protein